MRVRITILRLLVASSLLSCVDLNSHPPRDRTGDDYYLTDPGDADTDTDTDTDTTTHGVDSTDSGGESQFVPYGVYIYVDYGVNANQAVVPVGITSSSGGSGSWGSYDNYGPELELLVFTEGFGETCNISLRIGHPTVDDWSATDWFSWSFHGSDLVVDDDGCSSVTVSGYALADLWMYFDYQVSVGPLDPTIESYVANYPSYYDLSVSVGGQLGSDLFTDPTPFPMFVVTAAAVDADMNVVNPQSYLPASSIHQGGGVKPGFYVNNPWYYIGF